jgi:phosphomethylpyrimidine synthase
MSTRRDSLPSSEVANRDPLPGSKKVFVSGPDGMRVPFREIALSPTKGMRGEMELNPPFRVYDTSGPYTDPAVPIDLNQGLPELRRPWIQVRGEYETSEPVRRNRPDLELQRPRRVLRARGNATQMHFARKGIVTPEMEYVAIRENLSPEFVRSEVARGRAIIPANINHPESEPMAIGRNFLVKINANIGNSPSRPRSRGEVKMTWAIRGADTVMVSTGRTSTRLGVDPAQRPGRSGRADLQALRRRTEGRGPTWRSPRHADRAGRTGRGLLHDPRRRLLRYIR